MSKSSRPNRDPIGPFAAFASVAQSIGHRLAPLRGVAAKWLIALAWNRHIMNRERSSGTMPRGGFGETRLENAQCLCRDG
jgi:hypothetical protein